MSPIKPYGYSLYPRINTCSINKTNIMYFSNKSADFIVMRLIFLMVLGLWYLYLQLRYDQLAVVNMGLNALLTG